MIGQTFACQLRRRHKWEQIMQPMKRNEIPQRRSLRSLPTSLTYAATVDVRNVEHEITEFMIRRACEEMDSQQQYPFCGRKPKQRHG